MTTIRNKRLSEQVRIRDFGLCRCCGFKGSEAHHIIPLMYGGEDNLKNMVWLCYTCHRDSPDNKQNFFEYMMFGGSKTQRALGMIITLIENKGLDFHHYFPLCKQIIKWMKEVDMINAIEKYNLKESLEIEDVNFNKERKEYLNKFKDKLCQENYQK